VIYFLVTFGLVAVTTIPRLVRTARHRYRTRMRMRDAAAELADRTLATVTGTVRVLDRSLVAPLSGRTCVIYVARVAIKTDALQQLVAPIEDPVETRWVQFALETDAGTVIVDDTAGDVDLPELPLIPRKLELEQRFLAERGAPPELARTAGFHEIVVEPGDRIAVHGLVIHEEHTGEVGERGYRDMPRRVRLVAHRDHALAISKP
jgi:hypothetical protein